MVALPMRWMLVAGLCVMGAGGSARGGDWPQWRGPGRDNHVPPGEKLPAQLPSTMQPIWRIDVGASFASPVVAAGRLYHLDLQDGKETVHALDAATGKEFWSAPLDAGFQDGWGTGPRCAPVADGDGKLLFVQSCRGELQCLAVGDGKVIWRTNFVKDFGAEFIGEKGDAVGAVRHGYNGSPIIDGEHLIAQVGSPKGAGLVCFGKDSGRVVWKGASDLAAYAAPVIASIGGVRQVVSFTAESLMGLDVRDGKVLWRVPLKTGLGRHCTTPVVAGDVVVVGSHQLGLVGVKVSRQGDRFQVERAWTNKDLAPNVTSAVAIGQHLYGHGRGRTLFCVDAATGAAAWTRPDGVFCSPDRAYATLIVMGQNILMLGQGGELRLFEADPKDFKSIGQARICGPTWCSPAYADGKLYLRDARQLFCLKLVE